MQPVLRWTGQQRRSLAKPGRASLSWTPAVDRRDNQVIKFSMRDCKCCPMKTDCTKAPWRTLTIRMKEHHEALQAGRALQKKAEIWEKYRMRAGIEGTISTSGFVRLGCARAAIV